MKTESTQSQAVFVALKRTQLVMAIVIPLATSLVMVTATYYKARADIDHKISDIQALNVETFAKQTDVEKIGTKIDVLAIRMDSMTKEWSHLNGYLKAKGLYEK